MAKVIDREEEQRLVALAQQGDHAAQEAFIQMHMGALFQFAGAYARTNPALRVDDLLQEARIAVLEGLSTYRSGAGMNPLRWCMFYVRKSLSVYKGLMNFAVVVPRGEMRRARDDHRAGLESPGWSKRPVSLDSASTGESYSEAIQRMLVVDGHVDDDVLGALPDPSVLLAGLNRQQTDVVRRRFFSEKEETLEQIGATYQPPITRERVRQIEAAAIARIRRNLRRLGIE